MATVSARIPDELKERLEKEDIHISEVMRQALKEKIEEERRKRLEDDIKKLQRNLDANIDTDSIVKSVRETRKNR